MFYPVDVIQLSHKVERRNSVKKNFSMELTKFQVAPVQKIMKFELRESRNQNQIIEQFVSGAVQTSGLSKIQTSGQLNRTQGCQRFATAGT